ncbi:MAG TPA: hypothetical protein VLS89_07910 [Candidatus Nanopelagicales bacterium]|nr:hypothetical protein [Candidatus Nanopelagicales bacterium]
MISPGDAAWLLPTAVEAWKGRKEIQDVWSRLLARVFGKSFRLAFTGMAGAGKTVLFQHITGAAYKAGYKPPLTSQASESGAILSPGRKIALTVVPGQGSAPRFEAIDALFLGEEPVDGVIHVVSNGFVSLRTRDAQRQLINDNGLVKVDHYLDFQRRQEIVDLAETCDLIRQSMRKHRKPSWMVVAVSKVDLYYSQLSKAESYYSPTGEGAFVDRIRQLEGQVGSDNFRWTARPACGWLEDFVWNEEIVASSFKPQGRDHYISSLVETIESYSTGVSGI